MNVAVIGCGYVGLVTAAGLASAGHRVIGIESDPRRLRLVSRLNRPSTSRACLNCSRR